MRINLKNEKLEKTDAREEGHKSLIDKGLELGINRQDSEGPIKP